MIILLEGEEEYKELTCIEYTYRVPNSIYAKTLDGFLGKVNFVSRTENT